MQETKAFSETNMPADASEGLNDDDTTQVPSTVALSCPKHMTDWIISRPRL